jgi:hypothetical protein
MDTTRTVIATFTVGLVYIAVQLLLISHATSLL